MRRLLPLCLLLLLGACGGHVGNYDAQLDQGLTQLQQQTEAELLFLANHAADPGAAYDAATFDKLRVQLDLVRTRAAATDYDETTVQQLYQLGEALLTNPPLPVGTLTEPANMRGHALQDRAQLHTPLSPLVLNLLTQLLQSDFTSILHLELSKRHLPGATVIQEQFISAAQTAATSK